MNACQQCGKCCDLNTYNLHVYPYDVQRWQARGQEKIIKELCFGIDSQKHQIWTFRKQADGHCTFHHNGHCSIYNSRPLTCRVYPATHGDECLSHVRFTHPNVHDVREFNGASKKFLKWDTDRVQQELIKLLTGHGMKLEFDKSIVNMQANA